MEEELARCHTLPLVLRYITFRQFGAAVNSPKFDAVEDVDRSATARAGSDMIPPRWTPARSHG
jgi:hypothetical protein